MSIFPETPPPPTPEHDKMDEHDSKFRKQCEDFLTFLAGEGYTLIKPEDNMKITGDYERVHLALNDAPTRLIMQFLGVDFDKWSAENDALHRWLRDNGRE